MIEKTRLKLLEFIGKAQKSQNQVSKEIGLSTSVISQFLNGTYSGNNEEIAQTVLKYLEMGSKRLENSKDEYYAKLNNTEAVIFAATYAHQNGELVIVHGDAGAGKTTALTRYANSNAGVIFLTANASSRTVKSVLYMICEALGRKMESTEFMMQRSLVNTLKDSKRLIIIDEADHLCTRALQTVRSLMDEAGIGIVLSGNDKIYQQMFGRGSMSYDQLRTRAIQVEVLNDYSIDEMQSIFPNLTDTESLSYILKIACEESLRTAKKCYKLATLAGKANGNAKISKKLLLETQRNYFREII